VEDAARSQVLRRLDFIEGHLEGVRRMVERDESCADILRQTYAVRRAIQKVETVMFAAYVASDVLTAPRHKRLDRVTAELVYLHGLRRGRRVSALPSPPSYDEPENGTKG
jgi:DNA-binding FrmR family transcriptional regulator